MTYTLTAQEIDEGWENKQYKRKTSFFLHTESGLLGNISLNGDVAVFQRSLFHFGVRLGVGSMIYNNLSRQNILLTTDVYTLMGHRKHFAELGYSTRVGFVNHQPFVIPYSSWQVGYRYQAPKKGWILRGGYMPIQFVSNDPLQHAFYLSVGYSF